MARAKKENTEKFMGFARKDAYIIIVLFLLAFGIRYYFKSAGLLHTDSVIEARAAEDTLATGRLQYLQGLGYPGEALLMTLTYAFFHLFGATSAEYSVIFASVLFGALCVPMLYVLVKKLYNAETIGVYAALILTFLPVQLSLSTFGKGHGMELFTILLTGYLAIVAGQKRDMKLKILAALSLGFAVAVRQTSGLFLPVFFLLYWRGRFPVSMVKKNGEPSLKLNEPINGIAVDMAIVIVITLAVFYLSFVPRMLYEPSYSLIDSIKSFSAEANTSFSPFSPMVKMSLAWATLSLTTIGWVLAAAGAYFSWKRDRFVTLTLMFWFALFFIYLSNVAMLSPRFVIPALVAVVVLAAVAIDRAGSTDQRISFALVFILIAAMMYTSNILSVLEYRKNYCGPCEFSKVIGNVTAQNAVIIAMDESQHYEYYAQRQTMGHPSGGDLQNPDAIKKNMDIIDALLRNGTPVYATTQGLSYDGLVKGQLAVDEDKHELMNAATSKVYSNLRYDSTKQTLTDVETGNVFPLEGIYTLELFNRFAVKPVLQMDNEDWHHSDIEGARYKAMLFNVTLRAKQGNATAPVVIIGG